MKAPEFPTNLEWFNVEAPLTIASQRGKLILLDFWTYCCINCMHVLPDLRYLEEKYPDSLTVIGLHSPKFPNERVGAHVAQAIRRYDIRHPIANDPGFSVWQQYGVHAWPTLVLIDTQGQLVGALPGEGHRQQLDQIIAQQIDIAKRNGSYDPKPLKIKLETTTKQNTLAFPGKILVTEDKIYLSDSGHQRILELDKHGKILREFGNGKVGLQDGIAAQATFNNPQGLALVDQQLFVADTDNHCIRAIELDNNIVKTVAGIGKQGGYGRFMNSVPLETALNSPWDLINYKHLIFIAMAGSHQIWAWNLSMDIIGAYAGSGYENIQDGAPTEAAFAQPSGLTISDDALYVADSEVSGIRQINLEMRETTTLVGMGLFEFGEVDGVGRLARLQHPLGVAYDKDRNVLWIADTYNHKIRKLDLTTHVVSTLQITEKLSEPGGLSYSGNTLWIADTNNHRIVKVDVATGNAENFVVA